MPFSSCSMDIYIIFYAQRSTHILSAAGTTINIQHFGMFVTVERLDGMQIFVAFVNYNLVFVLYRCSLSLSRMQIISFY